MTAPVVHHMQNRVMARFHRADAVRPDSARTLEELGQRESLVFKYLCRRGVIVQAGPGRFYLDPVREQEFRRRRFWFVVAVIGIGLFIGFLAIVLALVLR